MFKFIQVRKRTLSFLLQAMIVIFITNRTNSLDFLVHPYVKHMGTFMFQYDHSNRCLRKTRMYFSSEVQYTASFPKYGICSYTGIRHNVKNTCFIIFYSSFDHS